MLALEPRVGRLGAGEMLGDHGWSKPAADGQHDEAVLVVGVAQVRVPDIDLRPCHGLSQGEPPQARVCGCALELYG